MTTCNVLHSVCVMVKQMVRNIQSAHDGVFLVLTPALVHRHHTVTVVSASVELYINVGSLASTLC